MRISDWSSDVCSSDLVTILAYGTMVHVALATAEAEGIDAEVIDLRTIVPVDIETIEASVKKTGRCVVVHEATRTAGFGAELSRSEEHTSELQSLMRNSYAVFCLKKKKKYE